MKLTLVAILAAGLSYLAARRSVDELARRAMVRAPNHRGIEVASTGGLAILLGWSAAAVVGLLTTTPWSANAAPLLTLARDVVAIQVIAGLTLVGFVFALVGLYADLGDREHGWRMHLRAIGAGRATPGAIRVVAGAAGALLLVPAGTLPERLVAGAIVALSATILDALDERPLRAMKGAGAWIGIILLGGIVAAEVRSIPGALVIGATVAALWRPEATERIMLGTAGSNLLGAGLGWLSLVAVESASHRGILLGVLALLTAVAVGPGFSSIVQRTGPLRRLDLLGRQPDPLPTADLPDEPV